MKLFTIGHSNRQLREFLEILMAHDIQQIIDVRTIPKSRRLPWFNGDALQKELLKRKIKYKHLPKLGGLRHADKNSINTAWRNESFRGFADYMQTKDFFMGLKELIALLKAHKRSAIMCAEAVPWRCHRSMISDALIVRGIKVLDILSKTQIKPHQLTSFIVVDKKTRPIKVFYPLQQASFIVT